MKKYLPLLSMMIIYSKLGYSESLNQKPSGQELQKIKDQKIKFYDEKINKFKKVQNCIKESVEIEEMNECNLILQEEINKYNKKE